MLESMVFIWSGVLESCLRKARPKEQRANMIGCKTSSIAESSTGTQILPSMCTTSSIYAVFCCSGHCNR